LRADALAKAGAALHPSAVVPLCSQKVGPCPIPTIRSRIRRPMAGCASNNSEELLRLAEAELPEREAADSGFKTSGICGMSVNIVSTVRLRCRYVANVGFNMPRWGKTPRTSTLALSTPASIALCPSRARLTVAQSRSKGRSLPGTRRESGEYRLTPSEISPVGNQKWQTTCIGLKNTPE